jgi:hypothetical protein
MGKCIIQLDGKFMHWSSVTDAPETPLLPEPLFAQYWKDEYGRSGMVDYANMMDRAKTQGHSSRFSTETVNSLIRNNRAGQGDKTMTKKQIIEAYTMTDAQEFIEWSHQRTKAFMDMAIRFGPVGWAERQKKKKVGDDI